MYLHNTQCSSSMIHSVRDQSFKKLAICRGEGSKIGQICQQIVIKSCQRRGVEFKNGENLPTSLMDDPYGASTYYGHFDILQLQDVGGQSVFF